MDVFWAAPPISRTLAAAAFSLSILAHTGIIPFLPFVFIQEELWSFPPQIWRLVTPFLITGSGLSILFDTYFLYRYGSQLEKGSPRLSGPGDFFTYVLFVMSMILITCGFILRGPIFLSALILAFTYTYAQDNPNMNVHFFVIEFPAKYLPAVMVAVAFVTGGPAAAMSQATGIFAAHLYDFLTRIWPAFGGGSKDPLIKTPWFIAQKFGAYSRAPQERDYGTAINPIRNDAPAAGRSTGWSARGPGQRLG